MSHALTASVVLFAIEPAQVSHIESARSRCKDSSDPLRSSALRAEWIRPFPEATAPRPCLTHFPPSAVGVKLLQANSFVVLMTDCLDAYRFQHDAVKSHKHPYSEILKCCAPR